MYEESLKRMLRANSVEVLDAQGKRILDKDIPDGVFYIRADGRLLRAIAHKGVVEILHPDEPKVKA